MKRAAALLLSAACVTCATPRDAGSPGPRVLVQARRFEFSPARLQVRAGIPTTLELESLDVVHGFAVPDLGVRSDVVPGHPTRVRLLVRKPGTLAFHCDVFCGEGHEEMTGLIDVTP